MDVILLHVFISPEVSKTKIYIKIFFDYNIYFMDVKLFIVINRIQIKSRYVYCYLFWIYKHIHMYMYIEVSNIYIYLHI